jgi:benzoyl-CoA reductase/2-hydroxyglutaryl-CoA dehydratase subunit BcrC/BadD/HgdB
MADIKHVSDMVFDGDKTIIDVIIEKADEYRIQSGEKFRPWDAEYWKMARSAQKDGKKLVLISGPAPVEIIYAMDCVPLYLDFLPTRLSGDIELTARLIREADKRGNSELCSMNKTEIGVLISGKLGLVPDAYVSAPIPCDSARAAYSIVGLKADFPVFSFDIPMCRDERSLQYIGLQLDALIEFMEKLTGQKLDFEKLKYRMELSNRAGGLLEECTALRRVNPCPMSSHLSVLNELMNAMAPTEEMVSLLSEELEICSKRAAEGISPCPGGEKHRVLILHNLFWQGIDISDRLESEYGAVTVMDGFPLKARDFFEHTDDISNCKRTMCGRMLWGSTVHGAAVSGAELCEALDGVVRDFSPDVSIFLGSSGCRHAWASQKMISDVILAKYNIPTLVVDVDNTDRRYKSEKDVFAAISDYMDTVINKK